MRDEIAELMAAHGLVDPEANDRSALAQCTQHARYLRSTLTDAKSRIVALEAGLERYGGHLGGCTDPFTEGKLRCDCGYSELVEKR